MTSLPTTRIDTLSPLVSQNGESSSLSNNSNYSDSSQQILLVDFVPNGKMNGSHGHGRVGSGASDASSSSVTTGSLSFPSGANHSNPFGNFQQQIPNVKMYPASSYQVPVQIQPHPQLQASMPFMNNPNDLSNFTLVNLNQHEPVDDLVNGDPDISDCDHQEEGMPMMSEIQRRDSNMSYSHKNAFVSNSRRSSQSKKGLYKSLVQQPQHNSLRTNNHPSSLTSSTDDDSDTGFLVPNHGKRSNGRLKNDPHHQYSIQTQQPIASPEPGFIANESGQSGGHRKKLRRRRSTPRRKPTGQRNPDGSELFPICCCFDDQPSGTSSLTSKYLRFFCFIVTIIFIITFSSIIVSLQRKVDALSFEVKRLTSTGGGYESLSVTKAPDLLDPNKANKTLLEEIIIKQEQFNMSISSFKSKLDDLSQKLVNLEKQPSVDAVRQDLARLGSDMKGSIEEMQKDIQNLKKAAEANVNRPNNQNSDTPSHNGPQGSKTQPVPQPII